MRLKSNVDTTRRTFLQLGIAVGFLPVLSQPGLPITSLDVSYQGDTAVPIQQEAGNILRLHDGYKLVKWFCRKYLAS